MVDCVFPKSNDEHVIESNSYRVASERYKRGLFRTCPAWVFRENSGERPLTSAGATTDKRSVWCNWDRNIVEKTRSTSRVFYFYYYCFSIHYFIKQLSIFIWDFVMVELGKQTDKHFQRL